MSEREIVGIDLFCGAGGLTYGLGQAGIKVALGVDLDPACEYPFTANNDAEFLKADIKDVSGASLLRRYPKGSIRLLAGCAPCRPFSPLRRKSKGKPHEDWSLLEEFGRLVKTIKPELVTMENVPDLRSRKMFKTFVRQLKELKYKVDYKSVFCPRLGIPQARRRLVLLASRIGEVKVPIGELSPDKYSTVRQAIGEMPELEAGKADPKDKLHKARSLSKTNLRRLQASSAGGTWRDWDHDLRAPCHQKKTGASFQSVYARMTWDDPSPTITTLSYNFGTGRFGHPEQDRAISLREAAILQTFPKDYEFVKVDEPVYLMPVGRLIGNAVPPALATAVGAELVRVASAYNVKAKRAK